jgi:putative glycerol-1-phosphate prenyltransferase
MLIESGTETATTCKTAPLGRNNLDLALATAQGEMLGSKLIYLEAGSGARLVVPVEMIELIAQILKYR